MEGVRNELEFYSKFARPLIFVLPKAEDRVLAASWVKKIKEDENTSEKLKTDYIKLLLFALQRKKLVGIFTDDPTKYETLEEFPDEYDLNAMAQDLIEAEQKERRSNIRRQLQGQMGDFPPYTTDISSDLREYVAAQDIPCFGVHCYYAISKDPITSWQNADKGIYPKPAKSAVNTNSPAPPGSKAPDTCGTCPGPEGTEPCSPRSHPADQPESEKRKKKSKKKLGDTPPVKPLVTELQQEEDEARKSPTWSSNLIEVIERPRSTTGAIPKVRSEKQIRRGREKREQLGDLDSEIEEDYNEMERALKDFQRGEIREQKRKREKRSKADDLDMEETTDKESDEDGKVEYDFENFVDLDETQYEQELKEDTLLVQYFKDTINKRIIQKEKDSLKDTIRGTLPAQSGIPLTTPKPSVSPKRVKTTPPVYTFDEPLTKDTTKQTDTTSPKPTCSYSCSGRDPDMDKIFQEASAIVKLLDDDLEPDYSFIEQSQQYEEERSRYEQPPLPEPQVPPREPTQRLAKGSPAAHKIFADVIPPLIEQLQPEAGEEPPYPSEMLDEDIGMALPAAKQEYEYIDSLFEEDKSTANMIKQVSNMISDEKPPYEKSPMLSPLSPRIRSDQQLRQPVTQFQQPMGIQSPAKISESEEGGPLSLTKITQSSTTITTSIPVGEGRAAGAERIPSPVKSPGAPSFGTPPSTDGRIFDFAKGWVPPRYKSPTGIGLESPPQFMSPGREGAPSLRTESIPPDRARSPTATAPVGPRICSSARRRLFGDMDTDTFLAQAEARQQGLPALPSEGKQISPSVRRRMQIHGIDTETFLSEATARQQELPPLPTDYIPPQRIITPPRKGGIPGWESPERPLPKTSAFSPQLLSREMTPPFFDSPKSPATPPSVAPYAPSHPSVAPYARSPPFVAPYSTSPPSVAPYSTSPPSVAPYARTPPFVVPYSTSPNLFDTSMGDQYFSPPPIASYRSPDVQQTFDRVHMPSSYETPKSQVKCSFYKSPKSQVTPPFSVPDGTSANLLDTSMGELYFSPPPTSTDVSPGMQQMLSPTQPRARDVQVPSRRSPPPSAGMPPGSPPPTDEFGLPLLVQISPLSKYDQYSRLYERYPDLQSPQAGKRRETPSSRTPPADVQVQPRLGIRGVDTDTFLAEAMARQQNLPPLPPDYPLPQNMRTPPRWATQDGPWLSTPPYTGAMLDEEAMTFYDSPKAEFTPPSGKQYLPSPPMSPDMSPRMLQMLEQLPQAQSFRRCNAQQGGSSRVGGGKYPTRSGPPSALQPIAGSPPTESRDSGFPPPQGSQRSGNRPCPRAQSSRFVAKGGRKRSSK